MIFPNASAKIVNLKISAGDFGAQEIQNGNPIWTFQVQKKQKIVKDFGLCRKTRRSF